MSQRPNQPSEPPALRLLLIQEIAPPAVVARRERHAMKIVAAFSTPVEAHLLVARLLSAGISAAVRDEYTITFNWLLSNAVGGVKVEVPDEDYGVAREIAVMPPTEEALLRCPYCGSSNTSVRVVSVFGALCMLLKLPIPMTRAIVDCRTCRKTHDVPMSGRNV